jgi:phytoene dehydrogenase-like protein
MPDAVVLGAGPNGLSAAITLAEAGLAVVVIEGADEIGGAARSAEVTLPGFVHDLGSAVYPLGIASPAFRQWPLEAHGLEWVHPDVPLAHPMDDGGTLLLHRDVAATAAQFGGDEKVYSRFAEPLLQVWDALLDEVMQPLMHLPRHPISLVQFGLRALMPARTLAEYQFRDPGARALFAGNAAHSTLRMESPASSAFGIVLQMSAHHRGWPVPRGGAGRLTAALGSYFAHLGGRIELGHRVRSWEELPRAPLTLFDLTPRQLLEIAPNRLPAGYRKRLEAYRYGPAAFKIDYALSEPIPWRSPESARGGTVHLGGTLDEISASEAAVNQGKVPERPFVLLAQPSVFDPTRAPEGRHTAWAYCHVPLGSTVDMTGAIENQIERFAPGFRNCVLQRYIMGPAALERLNPNLVGGDINGGSADLLQLIGRPVFSSNPYRIPVDGWYLCSASTPPGGGVHGMCGYLAAKSALKGFKRTGD